MFRFVPIGELFDGSGEDCCTGRCDKFHQQKKKNNLFMGASQSQISIQSPPTPLALVDNRFIMNQPVTLVMKERWFNDEFKIKDTMGTMFFQVDKRMWSMKHKRDLLDAYSQPVATYKRPLFACRYTAEITTPQTGPDVPIAEIKIIYSGFNRTFKIKFTNKVTNQLETIYLVRHSMSRSGAIYLGKQDAGGIPIATFSDTYGYNSFRRSEFFLMVAPGVDLSIPVFLLMAMEEEMDNERSRTNK